jgi:mRNA interferase HigB
MRLISKRNLDSAVAPYAEAKQAVQDWYTVFKANNWGSLNEIHKSYSPTVDEVYGYTIFNIKGKKYRLIVRINYKLKVKIIYFIKFLTHAEYNKINWSNENDVKQKLG